MSCFETQIDYNFVYAVQNLAKSASDIAESLKAADQKKAYSDEQVKEIIKSYPKEDLYELLNYDQKRYIRNMEQMDSIIEDTKSVMANDAKYEGMTDADVNAAAYAVADLWVEQGKYDANLDYWENINALLYRVTHK